MNEEYTTLTKALWRIPNCDKIEHQSFYKEKDVIDYFEMLKDQLGNNMLNVPITGEGLDGKECCSKEELMFLVTNTISKYLDPLKRQKRTQKVVKDENN